MKRKRSTRGIRPKQTKAQQRKARKREKARGWKYFDDRPRRIITDYNQGRP